MQPQALFDWERFLAIIACECLCGAMLGCDVIFQASALTKFLPTVLARKRTFVRVDTYVFSQIVAT